jgi:hypothetical protein
VDIPPPRGESSRRNPMGTLSVNLPPPFIPTVVPSIEARQRKGSNASWFHGAQLPGTSSTGETPISLTGSPGIANPIGGSDGVFPVERFAYTALRSPPRARLKADALVAHSSSGWLGALGGARAARLRPLGRRPEEAGPGSPSSVLSRMRCAPPADGRPGRARRQIPYRKTHPQVGKLSICPISRDAVAWELDRRRAAPRAASRTSRRPIGGTDVRHRTDSGGLQRLDGRAARKVIHSPLRQ